MTPIEMELSWLVFIATRDTGMDDAMHAKCKRLAWNTAKELAAQNPQEFAELPALLTREMTEAVNA